MCMCWQQNWKGKDTKCSINLSFSNYVVKTLKHYFEKIIVIHSWPHWSNHLTFLCDIHSYSLWIEGKRWPISNIFRAGERTQKEAFMPPDLIFKNYMQWNKFVLNAGASGWNAEFSGFLGPCSLWWHRENWPWPRVLTLNEAPSFPSPALSWIVKKLVLVPVDTSSCICRLHLQPWTVLGQGGGDMRSEIVIGSGRRDLGKRQLQT